MSTIKILFTCLFVMNYFYDSLQMYTTGCLNCDDIICPKNLEQCSAGIVKDICNCCPLGVCGNLEGDRCYNEQKGEIFQVEDKKFGLCGNDMECILREYYNEKYPESVCVCNSKQVVCGTNGQTYDTLCQLKQDRFSSESNRNIQFKHWGPCKTAPNIVTPPENTLVDIKRDLYLVCEVKGYPIPSVKWEFISNSTDSIILPGDDFNIAVQTRGGPEAQMVTSYMQILSARASDAGIYTCIADNSQGKANASAVVNVK